VKGVELINWEKVGGLLPVVVQDWKSGEVLMVAYMDRKALELTLSTGFAHYFSRTRNRIWKKGEQSGNLQRVKEVLIDCDGDTLLLKVEQKGVACHTGRRSCFFRKLESGEEVLPVEQRIEYNFLDRLYHTLLERKEADPSSSYVASLYKKGENGILKKVVEESGEFCFAVKDGDKSQIVYEGADLLFHLLVALAYCNLHPDALIEELKRREGVSGLEEKRRRKEKGGDKS
jgi:phosphoribosyl-ATP pyrophosphohydrolase/phosphoribosyl-AMP cyclohydrolase